MLVATLLAVGSAAIHASWNLLIKVSEDRAVAAWGQFGAAALLAAVGLVVVGGPGWAATPYLLGTAVLHVVYLEALVAAYTHGDFSLSYPMARGSGAVLAAVAGAVLLGDRLPLLGWLAIAVAGVGLVGLRGRGDAGGQVPNVVETGGSSSAVVYALITGAAIATYTVVDSAGARAASSGVSYALACVAAAGFAVVAMNLARPSRRARMRSLRVGWWKHLAGGAGTLVAYTMVLVAVRSAPVGYVTMLRESSVVIGALVGWRLLGEGLGGRRLAASGVVLAGLVLLVVASL